MKETPNADDLGFGLVTGYLARRGWVKGGDGPAGALWRLAAAKIGVPFVIRYASTEWQGVVNRIAAAEKREPSAVEADILGRPPNPLTCEGCKSKPATHLLVADFSGARVRRLVCEPCGIKDAAVSRPAGWSVYLFALTEVTHA